ncbi:hypothetical protein KCP76_00830 [Salmonella enterica subsp. enterica serovar Weltevreden]|nr:hypothetical protein KCP76_00830 [Salmonella enterica subsp. enterica serovar Weltevreden]
MPRTVGGGAGGHTKGGKTVTWVRYGPKAPLDSPGIHWNADHTDAAGRTKDFRQQTRSLSAN